MFLCFSNRLGCLGSLLVSAILTIVLLLILGVLSRAHAVAPVRRRPATRSSDPVSAFEGGEPSRAERALRKAAGPGGRDGLAPQDVAPDSVSTTGSQIGGVSVGVLALGQISSRSRSEVMPGRQKPCVRRLQGKRALVTSASGIGAATARLLPREGADVALIARNTAGLEEVARRVEGEGARAVVVPADVADREAVERAVEQGADALGGLDVVVVAAAAGAFGRFAKIPPEDFDRCVRISFGAAVDTIRAVMPHLERSSGRLVVIGSAVDSVALWRVPGLRPLLAALALNRSSRSRIHATERAV